MLPHSYDLGRSGGAWDPYDAIMAERLNEPSPVGGSHTATSIADSNSTPEPDPGRETGGQSGGENAPSGGGSESKAAIIAALAANIGIAVTKFIAYALTGMSSMLAEGIHSLADSGNQVLLLGGGKRAKRDADPTHPFGYGRERYLAGFIVSIIVFSLGGLFSLFEAYEKFHEMTQPGAKQPSVHDAWWWVPLAVLVASILMEGKALHTTVKESRKLKGDRSWVQFVKEAKNPELPVLLCEDAAAVTGLTFALAGVAASLILENGIWDAVGAGMIGVLLIAVAAFLYREMRSLLLGESASFETRRAIWQAMESVPGVERVIHMKTMHLGPQELLVAAKVAVAPESTGRDIAAAIDQAERAIRGAQQDMQMLVYIEPDLDLGGKGSLIGHRSSAEHADTPDELVNDAPNDHDRK